MEIQESEPVLKAEFCSSNMEMQKDCRPARIIGVTWKDLFSTSPDVAA